MLKVGDVAPPFEAEGTNGAVVSLARLHGKPVVVYFFPKAFTPGCTLETKAFRDRYPDIVDLGAEIIGVSTDTLDTQCRFAMRYGLEFPLVGDPRGEIAAAYGVLRPILPYARRVTYVVDEQGCVAALFEHEFQAWRHLDDVLEYLRLRRTSRRFRHASSA
jgi:peroxiredoxin Q/BCP